MQNGDTSVEQAEIGLIGLGVMGSNLALNIAEKGNKIAVFKIGLQNFHLLINGIASLDHDDDRARRADGGYEVLDGFARDDLSLQFAGFGVKFLR